jgi:hypothetical protein
MVRCNDVTFRSINPIRIIRIIRIEFHKSMGYDQRKSETEKSQTGGTSSSPSPFSCHGGIKE